MSFAYRIGEGASKRSRDADTPRHGLMFPADRRGILYWTREGGEPGSDGIGPAWVIEADATERPINGGDPITRAEAERLARAGDYFLDAEP